MHGHTGDRSVQCISGNLAFRIPISKIAILRRRGYRQRRAMPCRVLASVVNMVQKRAVSPETRDALGSESQPATSDFGVNRTEIGIPPRAGTWIATIRGVGVATEGRPATSLLLGIWVPGMPSA